MSQLVLHGTSIRQFVREMSTTEFSNPRTSKAGCHADNIPKHEQVFKSLQMKQSGKKSKKRAGLLMCRKQICNEETQHTSCRKANKNNVLQLLVSQHL